MKIPLRSEVEKAHRELCADTHRVLTEAEFQAQVDERMNLIREKAASKPQKPAKRIPAYKRLIRSL